MGTVPELITIGYVDLSKYEDHYLKLKRIFERTIEVIDEFHPDELAIEAPFFGKNVQSMLKLGRAQGAAIAAAVRRRDARCMDICTHPAIGHTDCGSVGS